MSECVYICVVLVKVLMGNRWHSQIIWVGKHRKSTGWCSKPGLVIVKEFLLTPGLLMKG